MAIVEKYPNEGKVTVKVMKTVRRECEFCGNAACYRHGFLLERFRSNPASSAYGRDDCTWCEDDKTYTCANIDCVQQAKPPDGYVGGTRFSAVEQYGHMFLIDREVELSEQLKQDLANMLAQINP